MTRPTTPVPLVAARLAGRPGSIAGVDLAVRRALRAAGGAFLLRLDAGAAGG